MTWATFWPQVLGQAVGVILGGGITWFCARYYYQRAGAELRVEATELRRLVELVLHALETADLVELNRDESGRIQGLVVRIEVPTGRVKLSGQPVRPEPG